MKVKKYLIEGTLDKTNNEGTGFQDLTTKWFDVREDPKMSMTDKRKAYDKLYDTATEKVFDMARSTPRYNKIKEFMRQMWLKLGFEAGDGNNKAINLAQDLVSSSMKSGNTDVVDKIVSFTINNYDYVDDYLDNNNDISKFLKDFSVQRKDLWSEYTDNDIKGILKSLYKQIEDAGDLKSQLALEDKYMKTSNLRDLLKDLDSTDSSKSVKVPKVSQKSNVDAITQVLKQTGILDNKETVATAQKILSNQ